MEALKFRKDNYCKYNRVRDDLIRYLELQKSAKDSAKELGISLQTYYKYKSIASIETGRVYEAPEERKFIERQKKKLVDKAEKT